jgi:hypothetical protein
MGQAGRYDAVLDYALAEYTFNDYIGIRGGRIRRPQGIYNDIQDVDLARTFVLLPQGVYDARYRDFYVSVDGGELFGTLPLRQAGSLSYEIYGGLLRPSDDGGVALNVRNSLPASTHLDPINPAKEFGGQVWWETPIDGLRFGASCAYDPEFDVATTTQTPIGSIRVDPSYDTMSQQYSGEYAWKAWTFQTECMVRHTYPKSDDYNDIFSWYAAAAYRFTKWLEVGSYYTQYYGDIGNPNGAGLAVPSDAYQKDAALAVRFDLTQRWIIKVEGHYIRGTGLLNEDSENPIRRGNGWWMAAVKTTISF